MKHRDVIKRILDGGGRLIRHGGDHDIYQGPSGMRVPVPRSKTIKKRTAEGIFKDLGV